MTVNNSVNVEKYAPLQSGAGSRISRDVFYGEQAANSVLKGIVHCYWTLKTMKPLQKNFIYTVMPDACVDIVFDVSGATDPIVMTPTVAIESLDLGKNFSYVGIRFLPGTLNGDNEVRKIIGNQTRMADTFFNKLELPEVRLDVSQSLRQQYEVLEKYVLKLVESRLAVRDMFTENVLRGMQYGLSVNEIAAKIGYSPRQLQRNVLVQTGYSPVQLRRIVRFQAVLSSGEYELRFADQSHLIKEFKAITGISYTAFARRYGNVRKVQE